RVVHAMCPANNFVDHGFYMISPTLLHDYYGANGYAVDEAYVCRFVPVWHNGKFDSPPWTIHRYEPGCLDHRYARFGREQLTQYFGATKGDTAGAAARLPQQHAYEQVWDACRAAPPGGGAAAAVRVLSADHGAGSDHLGRLAL